MYCKNITILICYCILIAGCIPSNTYEKNETILHHRWHNKDIKSFEISIKDTSSQYIMYLTTRHTDAYGFSNIWLDLETINPDSTSTKQKVELPLMEKSGRWTGRGMNEIYEHKIRLSGNTYTKFSQLGTYTVRLEQIMRQNPLKEIMSVGIRLEKVPSSQ